MSISSTRLETIPAATRRAELTKILPQYKMISDVIEGEVAVKSRGEYYLPKPEEGGSDIKACNDRYEAYLKRAVFYNVTKPTVDALTGQMFLREPKVTLPENMQGMMEDFNGEGVPFEQCVRKIANHVLPYGRAGLLADFPQTTAPVTNADIANGVKPSIKFYPPWAIINWREEKREGRMKLVLLVLLERIEQAESSTDVFTTEYVNQYRVFRLTEDGTVEVELHKEQKTTESVEDRNKANIVGIRLVDYKNQPFTEIPFEFIGAVNNDAEIDAPPMYDIASLNIAHYRNSADYEESVFLVGQPTPCMTGLSQDWVDENCSSGLRFGSRTPLLLPAEGDGKLIQAQPNTLSFEAMQHKEEQMVSIGARILKANNGVERKQVEVEMEAAGQRSVLMTIHDNIEAGLLAALQKASMFVGEKSTEIVVELNDNFDLTGMAPEEVRWLIELWKERLLTFESIHDNLQRSGLVKGTVEEARTAILEDQVFFDQVQPKEQEPKPELEPEE